MRLIDGDELYRKVSGYQGGAVDKTVAKRLIEQMPTIEPPTKCIAEVHADKEMVAKWINEALQNGIVHCKDCVYYDAQHIEKNGVRYEYADMPEEAFDEFGTGLVHLEYGINVGGRCCKDYNIGYAEDKRVYRTKNDYCSKGVRRTDDDSDK